VKKTKFWLKIDISSKNQKFLQKLKPSSKVNILAKNIFLKIQIFTKQKQKIDEKFDF